MSAYRHYKGYRIPGIGGKKRKVEYSIKYANFFLPRGFVWVTNSDSDLEDYIDALVNKKQLLASQYEEQGCAIDHVYVEEPPSEVLKLSSQLIMAFLRGEFPLEVALGTRIRITDPERLGRMVTHTIDCGAAEQGVLEYYKQAILDRARTGKALWLEDRIPGLRPIKAAIPADREDYNLAAAEEHGVPCVTAAPDPPQEETISTRQIGEHTQVISVALAEQPYFVRRIFRPDGVLVGVATAWSAEGPWAAC